MVRKPFSITNDLDLWPLAPKSIGTSLTHETMCMKFYDHRWITVIVWKSFSINNDLDRLTSKSIGHILDSWRVSV